MVVVGYVASYSQLVDIFKIKTDVVVIFNWIKILK